MDIEWMSGPVSVDEEKVHPGDGTYPHESQVIHNIAVLIHIMGVNVGACEPTWMLWMLELRERFPDVDQVSAEVGVKVHLGGDTVAAVKDG